MADLTLNNIIVFLNKSEARDKLARIVQFGSRGLVGATTELLGLADPRVRLVNGRASNLMSTLALARRSHRWCKEFPVIQQIPASLKIADPISMVLDTAQKVTLATFLIVDHYGWLKQAKVLNGKAQDTIWFGLKFFMVSNMISTVYNAYKLKNTDESKVEERKKLRLLVLKHAMMSIQIAHVSNTRKTSDFLVGILGVITSIMDAKEQWPKK